MSDVMKDALKKAGVQTTNESTNGGKPNKKSQKGSKGIKPARKKPPVNISGKLRGKIKWFNLHNGYGFIVGDDGNEYFIHSSNISSGRTYIGFEGSDTVEFRVSANPNGGEPRAVNAELVIDEPDSSEPELVADDQGDQDIETTEANQ